MVKIPEQYIGIRDNLYLYCLNWQFATNSPEIFKPKFTKGKFYKINSLLEIESVNFTKGTITADWSMIEYLHIKLIDNNGEEFSFKLGESDSKIWENFCSLQHSRKLKLLKF